MASYCNSLSLYFGWRSFLGIEKRILRQKLRTLEAAQAISSDNSAVGGSSQEGWSRWYLARIWWRDTLPEMARWVATNVGRMASDGCRQIMSTDGIDGYQQINWIPTETWFQSLSVTCIVAAMHYATYVQGHFQAVYLINMNFIADQGGTDCDRGECWQSRQREFIFMQSCWMSIDFQIIDFNIGLKQMRVVAG